MPGVIDDIHHLPPDRSAADALRWLEGVTSSS
jgi:hypothetical protein